MATILLMPFYVFSAGNPQPSDAVLVAILGLPILALRPSLPSSVARPVIALVAFTLYVALCNLSWAAITARTRAIVPVHYAGVACEMDTITAVARHHELAIVEDAAQGVMASYKGRALGTLGNVGAYSFHETKNVIAGEGGALLVNDPDLVLRAEILREKGTDRSRFFRGEVDRYTWQDVGSSFLPGELIAAFLWAQLEEAEAITLRRREAWARYHEWLAPLEAR